MLHYAVVALTDLGDSIVTLPLAVLVLIWLLVWGNRRAALAWLGALILCGGITAVLKIYFVACPVPLVRLDSPSGHTSMTFYVYGGLTLITAARLETWRRDAMLALGALFILAMAVSRAVLHFHSVSEVIIGLIIGGGALALFWHGCRGLAAAAKPVWPLWLATLVPILVLGGRSAGVENLLHRIAMHLHATVNFCV
jgi:membrane-associated phospholipid phosphatase